MRVIFFVVRQLQGLVQLVLTVFKWLSVLLSPFIFTIVNLKRRPTITSSVSYNIDSCPFKLVNAFLQITVVHVILNRQLITN